MAMGVRELSTKTQRIIFAVTIVFAVFVVERSDVADPGKATAAIERSYPAITLPGQTPLPAVREDSATNLVGDGETCESAYQIEALPFAHDASTCAASDDYDSACPWTSASPDVVYSYTPAVDMFVDVSLCYGSDYDTKLFILEGDCTAAAIACSEDLCSTPMKAEPFVSAIQSLQLSAGVAYYIVVDGYESICGNYTLDVNEVVPPLACSADSLFGQGPPAIGEPYSITLSDNAEPMNYRVIDNYSGVAQPVQTLRWWGSEVYSDFVDNFACVDSEDLFEVRFYADAAGQPDGEICSYLVTATKTLYNDDDPVYKMYEYVADLPVSCALSNGWVSVQGVGDSACWFWWLSSPVGDGLSYVDVGGELVAASDMAFCMSANSECAVDCPEGALNEPESCGLNTNGGCSDAGIVTTALKGRAVMPVNWVGSGADPSETLAKAAAAVPSTPLDCGTTVCGTFWTDGGVRDTDWYEIVVTEDTELVLTVTGEIPLLMGFVESALCGSGSCDDQTGVVNPFALPDGCEESVASICVPPGVYYAFVAPQFAEGYPCGTSNSYVISLDCSPCVVTRGACCESGGGCSLVPECQCEGDYMGDNTTCDQGICPSLPSNDVCLDAEPIETLPASILANLTLANSDVVESCGVPEGPYKEVWYSVIGTGNTMTATTCNVNTLVLDTKLSVFCAECDEPMCVDGSDDDATCVDGWLLSTVTWCSKAGATYYIAVGKFADNGEGDLIQLDVTDDGVGCLDPLDCPSPLDPPDLVGLYSRREHGDAGSFDLPLNLGSDSIVEPRADLGDARLVFAFDGPIEATDGTLTCGDEVTLVNATCEAVSIIGNEVVVDVSLPDNMCVEVTLSGVQTLFGIGLAEGSVSTGLKAHVGDVTADGMVNLSDLLAIKGKLFAEITESTYRYDIAGTDGNINLSDLLATKGNLFAAIDCP